MMDGDARDPKPIAVENGWLQVSDHSELEGLCDRLISQHPDTVYPFCICHVFVYVALIFRHRRIKFVQGKID